jgi:hypothetical protein
MQSTNTGNEPANSNPNQFICPECGSFESAETINLTTPPEPESSWSDVMTRILCAKCKREIPVHLAERWDGMPPEQAQQQWQEVYRDAGD